MPRELKGSLTPVRYARVGAKSIYRTFLIYLSLDITYDSYSKDSS